jgi:hypothetical protein
MHAGRQRSSRQRCLLSIGNFTTSDYSEVLNTWNEYRSHGHPAGIYHVTLIIPDDPSVDPILAVKTMIAVGEQGSILRTTDTWRNVEAHIQRYIRRALRVSLLPIPTPESAVGKLG